MVSPIAFASRLFEANIVPKSNIGRITGHGNLVDAKAMLRMAGKIIATSHRIELVMRSFFFPDFVMASCLVVVYGI